MEQSKRPTITRAPIGRACLYIMAMWPKALPMTARRLSPLSGFEFHLGHVRKMPVTWGKPVFFAG